MEGGLTSLTFFCRRGAGFDDEIGLVASCFFFVELRHIVTTLFQGHFSGHGVRRRVAEYLSERSCFICVILFCIDTVVSDGSLDFLVL